MFNQQWQAELDSTQIPVKTLDPQFWHDFRVLPATKSAYCFYPSGAVQTGKRLLARRQKTSSAIAAGILLLVLTLPFISNWVQLAWLDYQVASYEELSTKARHSQNAVFDMEDQWGAVAEYPRQDVATILLTLNQFIDSSLTSFDLKKGEVDIVGVTQDPALLIEQLGEQEYFFNVAQSRSSSGNSAAGRGDRFGIRLNISGVDFPAYEADYPESEL